MCERKLSPEDLHCHNCGNTKHFEWVDASLWVRDVIGVMPDGGLEIKEGYYEDMGYVPHVRCKQCKEDVTLPCRFILWITSTDDDEPDDDEIDDAIVKRMTGEDREIDNDDHEGIGNMTYIHPDHRHEENAEEFANYLQDHCEYTAMTFPSRYIWEDIIPPSEHWAQRVEELNRFIRSLEATT